jgi:hypothetical protein
VAAADRGGDGAYNCVLGVDNTMAVYKAVPFAGGAGCAPTRATPPSLAAVCALPVVQHGD